MHQVDLPVPHELLDVKALLPLHAHLVILAGLSRVTKSWRRCSDAPPPWLLSSGLGLPVVRQAACDAATADVPILSSREAHDAQDSLTPSLAGARRACTARTAAAIGGGVPCCRAGHAGMWMLRTDSPASGLPGADCCMAGLPRLQCCILAPDALRLLAVREPGCHAVVNLVIVLQCTKLQADNQGWSRSCPRARNRARRVSAKGSEPGNEQRMESMSRKAQQVEAKAFERHQPKTVKNIIWAQFVPHQTRDQHPHCPASDRALHMQRLSCPHQCQTCRVQVGDSEVR